MKTKLRQPSFLISKKNLTKTFLYRIPVFLTINICTFNRSWHSYFIFSVTLRLIIINVFYELLTVKNHAFSLTERKPVSNVFCFKSEPMKNEKVIENFKRFLITLESFNFLNM